MQNFRNAAEAIFEIVDNSVDAADVEGRKLRVEIEWTPERIVVTDRGGRGMGLDGLRRFFRWGDSEKAGVEGALGRFGQGGKAAMGYLARSFTITAKAAGERFGYRIADRDYRDRAGGTKRYQAERVDLPDLKRAEGYVRIELRDLNRRRIDARALAARVADVYRELIASGRCTIVLNGAQLEPMALPLQGPPTPVDFALPGGRRIAGWFGRLEPDVAKKGRLHGGLRLCVHGRLICDGEFFGHRGPWFKQSLNQLIGVLELSPVRVNMNKTDFDRDSDEWGHVQARLHDLLGPLVRELSGARDHERVTRSDWRRVRQAQQLVERALVQLELDELLPEEERAPRPKLRAVVPAPDVEAPAATAAEDARQPRLPLETAPARRSRPRPSLATRLRRHRVEWEPRLLTEDRRSDWEDGPGGPKLLINTRFPLYRETKGEVWYVVETGVFELTRRVRAGELSVDEYYEEVNRILQHAADAEGLDEAPLAAAAS